MNDKDFERYEKMFEQYKDRLVSYSDYMKQQPVKRGILGHLKEYLMALTKYILVRIKG